MIEIEVPRASTTATLPSPPSCVSNESEIDLSKEGDISMLFKRRPRKSLADSDTVTTCANSFTSSFRSDRSDRPKQWKCVRFALDKNDDPLTEEFESSLTLTEKEKASMWWQPQEFKMFRRYCRKAAEIARTSNYPDEFTKAYDACSGKHIQDMAQFSHVSRVHVRGLEAVVFPALVRARKLVVRGVVKTQEKLPETMGPVERAKVLSATSRCLSGRARLLARVFGVGDEEVAKDCYYSMDSKSESNNDES